MKKTLMIALLVSLAVLAAVQVAPALARPQGLDNVHVMTFHTMLTGSQQNPPVTTDAFGMATVRLIDNGTAIRFRVIVCNIADVIASHIHVGPAGTNGKVIIPFFGGGQTLSSPHGCRTLAEGTRTAADLNTKADPSITSWNDFVKALLAGNTYVNVHTTANPAGEIRGQLVLHRQSGQADE